MALVLFGITLFFSAFLLFLVQPLIGKMILPKLGGTPQVWNTCMMFFQTVLLLGYAYSHTVTTRLKLRQQMAVHCLLLLLPLGILLVLGPFSYVASWVPPAEENPIPQTLWLLTIVVGIPFLVVSTTAPLLQRWFSYSGHPSAKDPYFLYGASNLGSLLALVLYPFLIEPLLGVTTQALVWWVGFLCFGAMVVGCAALIQKVAAAQEAALGAAAAEAPAVHPEEPHKSTSTAIQTGPPPLRGAARKRGTGKPAASVAAWPSISSAQPGDYPVTWSRRIRWILLAAVPSSLMLGVTSYASIDLSPFPLLWVIPLALYLLSFILVFAKWPLVWTEGPHLAFLYLGPIAILVMCLIILTNSHNPSHVWISFAAFFCVACMCHGEFAKDRPSTRHLTEYFLLMSVGGMIGGVFNGLLAPIMFTGVVEYPLAIVAACLMRPRTSQQGWFDRAILQASP
ncbi:MAG: hypothetical protein NZO58_08480, partial [Gemmataceae bacterium]|nr:hypothetical protein [Gemmataceae bacterium]